MTSGFTKPSAGIRRLAAWTLRLGGLYAVLCIPWVYWKVLTGIPPLTPPPGLSAELFRLLVGVAVALAAGVGFFMFYRFYRQDLLPMASDIESWNFPKQTESKAQVD